MPEHDQEQSMYTLAASMAKVETTLSHMSTDMGEMKRDVKDLREGAPIHRIETLEGRWRTVTAWLGGLTLVVLGAIVTALLTGGTP